MRSTAARPLDPRWIPAQTAALRRGKLPHLLRLSASATTESRLFLLPTARAT